MLGRPREALACLEPLAIASLKHGLAHRLIELSVAQALALEALGERGRALAEPEGYTQIFAHEPGLAPLLEAQPPDAGPAPVDPAPPPHEAPAEADQPRSPRAPVAAPPGLLSAREVEVLHLVAERASNEQIAARLLVSPNTVKTHLRHIYEKLGVGGRREALARAEELGLLG